MRLVWRALAVSLAVALWLQPAPATAKPREVVLPGGVAFRFHIAASDGYRLLVTQLAQSGVYLTAYRRDASVTYAVRDRSRRGRRMQAHFPHLGRISVSFEPSGKPHRLQQSNGCSGRAPLIEYGVFRGRIAFRGERGYTEAHGRRARGWRFRYFRRRCRIAIPKRDVAPRAHIARFGANVFGRRRNTAFEATRFWSRANPAHGHTSFVAFTESRSRAMSVFRAVRLRGKLDAFSFSNFVDTPENLTISPPAPFSGTGAYQRTAESRLTWKGPLSVRFPGIDPVKLTGPRFDTDLCVDDRCISEGDPGSDADFIFVGDLLGPVPIYGSGSHSQPFADARLSWSR